LCYPLQMVQYRSQVQRSSGMSHCTQTVGPSMGALKKTVPEPCSSGKMNMAGGGQIFCMLFVEA